LEIFLLWYDRSCQARDPFCATLELLVVDSIEQTSARL